MSEVWIRRGALGAPGPTVEDLITNATHRVVVSWHKLAALIEFEDALFRTNRAVVMPLGAAPAQGDVGTVRSVASIAATVLRHAQEHPAQKILVAGHTDTTGSDAVNLELSGYRAEAVLSVITGDSDTFARICGSWARMGPADYKQILRWVADTRGWDTDPGPIDDTHTAQTTHAINEFRRLYNEEGPGATWAPKTPLWGDATQKELWVAFFNMYEEALVAELGEGFEGLAALRAGVRFLIPDRFVGCGEEHPREAENIDEYRSQTNRRVEVLFFDPQELPVMSCHPGPGQCQGGQCELYDRHRFRRRILPAMPSALPWRAAWSQPLTHRGEVRQMRLNAPGLPAGYEMTFEITQVGYGPIGEVVVTSQEDGAMAPFDEWFVEDSVQRVPQLARGQEFPFVEYTFVMTGAGRRVESEAPLRYADRVHLQVLLEGGAQLSSTPYLIATEWGMREGITDLYGVLDEGGLPPGGAIVLLYGNVPLHLEQLEFH